MFTMLLSIASSIFSMAMMGYLSMSTELGPWIAPIFMVVVMVIARPYLKGKKASESIIAVVTSSSLAGMVGMCLGLSFPSFFFTQQRTFKILLESPLKFSLVVGCFVIASALYGFLLGYMLHHYFLVEEHRKFPMSRLVYDVLHHENPKEIRFLAMVGVVVSFVINKAIGFFYYMPTRHLVNFNMYPLLVSLGFITGQAIAVPALIGLITRVITFRLIHIYIPSTMTDKSLVITFCIGMIFAWFILNLNIMFIRKTSKYWQTHSFLLNALKKRWFWAWIIISLIASFGLLMYWKLTVFFILPILMMLVLLSLYSINILSLLGFIDISTYVLFVLFGMIYFIPSTMATMIAVSVFATLSLGIVIDLIFSYKLASLAQIHYKFVTKYQIVGIVTAVIFSGICFWYFCTMVSIQSYSFIVQKTYQIENIFKYSEYSPHIFLAGFIYAAVLDYLKGDLLAIVGGVLMAPEVSTVLIVSGAFANMIKNREKIYPVFLGVYAGHMLWLLFGMFK